MTPPPTRKPGPPPLPATVGKPADFDESEVTLSGVNQGRDPSEETFPGIRLPELDPGEGTFPGVTPGAAGSPPAREGATPGAAPKAPDPVGSVPDLSAGTPGSPSGLFFVRLLAEALDSGGPGDAPRAGRERTAGALELPPTSDPFAAPAEFPPELSGSPATPPKTAILEIAGAVGGAESRTDPAAVVPTQFLQLPSEEALARPAAAPPSEDAGVVPTQFLQRPSDVELARPARTGKVDVAAVLAEGAGPARKGTRGSITKVTEVKSRPWIALVLGGAVVIGLLAFALSRPSRPSRADLDLIYPYGFEGTDSLGRTGPRADEVTYEFRSMVSCRKFGEADCLQYEFHKDGIVRGTMVVRRDEGRWKLVPDEGGGAPRP